MVTEGGARPHIGILETAAALPIAGHTTVHAMHEVYAAIRAHKTTLVFVNTRMQAEFAFHELWKLNDDNLAIALHHGSLDVAQRRKVEAAMAEGRLRAVVCTSTLDLGIDWGDVDLVVNLGAPKGASRMMQRIGRANHRLDEPSKAFLVPSNRFEMLECRAALDAVAEAAQDTPEPRVGALDVLAQHVLGVACAEAFDADQLFDEVRSAAPYAELDARRIRRGRQLRGDWRLCASDLRPLRQDQAGAGRTLACHQPAHRTAIPHECRHHRRGRHGQGAARPRAAAGAAAVAVPSWAGACSARSRNTSPRR